MAPGRRDHAALMVERPADVEYDRSCHQTQDGSSIKVSGATAPHETAIPHEEPQGTGRSLAHAPAQPFPVAARAAA